MNEKLLQETIEQSQKTLSQSKDWQAVYATQAEIMQNNQELLKQFYKSIKGYEHLQFYLMEVCPKPPAIFKIIAKYQGQPVALITITKESTIISTEDYDDTNKKVYNCSFKLKDIDIKAVETMQFLNYFNQELTPKGKIDEQAHTQAMLLSEFR